MKYALLAALQILSLVSVGNRHVQGAELRTYRFADDTDRLFVFGRGLLDYHFRSKLAGSFDVTIDDSGMMSISRFDVSVADAIEEGVLLFASPEGVPLADLLFENPVHLAASRYRQIRLCSPPIGLRTILLPCLISSVM